MIVGVDEAGRGPVLGPLVVAGVAVESDVALRHMNVRDSKKLSPERREALAPEIEKIAKFELVVIPAERIDDMRAEMSLNDFEAKLFAEIIHRLHPETAYVDAADVDEIEFKRSVQRELPIPVEIVSQHNADELFPVVSAASILAKVRRDQEMRAIEQEFGVPIGSGYSHDPQTIAFLEKWIKEKGTLPPHTRTSWDTARRLLAESRNRKLDEFGGGTPMREMLEDLIRTFNAKVASDPTLRAELGDLRKTVLIDLKDGMKYHFTLEDQKVAALLDGGVDHADITISTDVQTLRALILREIGPFKAYATGKIKLKGSLEDLARFRKFF